MIQEKRYKTQLSPRQAISSGQLHLSFHNKRNANQYAGYVRA